jgi:hypothetical protein
MAVERPDGEEAHEVQHVELFCAMPANFSFRVDQWISTIYA